MLRIASQFHAFETFRRPLLILLRASMLPLFWEHIDIDRTQLYFRCLYFDQVTCILLYNILEGSSRANILRLHFFFSVKRLLVYLLNAAKCRILGSTVELLFLHVTGHLWVGRWTINMLRAQCRDHRTRIGRNNSAVDLVDQARLVLLLLLEAVLNSIDIRRDRGTIVHRRIVHLERLRHLVSRQVREDVNLWVGDIKRPGSAIVVRLALDLLISLRLRHVGPIFLGV